MRSVLQRGCLLDDPARRRRSHYDHRKPEDADDHHPVAGHLWERVYTSSGIFFYDYVGWLIRLLELRERECGCAAVAAG